jgi:hypothetical protein
MKTFWGKISKSGGAGTNPEREAIKGYIRKISLFSTDLAMKDEKTTKEVFLHFSVSPSFQFHQPIRTTAKGSQYHVQYSSLLKFMFAGNFGSVLEGACLSFPAADTRHARSLSLADIQFFEKLQRHGQSPDKYFCTYIADMKNAKKVKRNLAGTNRCGSTVLIRGLPSQGEIAVRIQVHARHVCSLDSNVPHSSPRPQHRHYSLLM